VGCRNPTGDAQRVLTGQWPMRSWPPPARVTSTRLRRLRRSQPKPRRHPGLPLGLPEQATTVRVQDGKAQASDGPFLGDGGAVGGYFIFEADDLDAAIELAARIPAARLGGAIEVRPVGTYW
jgi:hypothetical protein